MLLSRISIFLILFSLLAAPISYAQGEKLGTVKNAELEKLLKETPKKESKKRLTKEEKKVAKAQKAMWLAHLLRQKKKNRITELELIQKRVPVFLVPRDESFRPLIKLDFTLDEALEGWKLFDINGLPIRYNELSKNYRLYAYLNSRVSTVDVVAKGPKGETKEEQIYVYAPEAKEFRSVSIFDSIHYSLGHTYLVYEQSTLGKYVAQALLIGVRYLSPETGRKLGFYADAWSTIYTYEASDTPTSVDRSSHFLEARAGITYAQKLFPSPRLRSRFFLGVSNINLFSLGGGFGFNGLFGPDLGLRTEFYKSGKNSYATEIQYTPYEYDDPLGERRVKVSLDWNRNLQNMRRMQFGLSYSDNSFEKGAELIEAKVYSAYFALSF